MSRGQFEKWAQAGNRIISKNDSGAYTDFYTVLCWAAWQARQPEIDALKAEVERLRKYAERDIGAIEATRQFRDLTTLESSIRDSLRTFVNRIAASKR